jgi:hypothetical protein
MRYLTRHADMDKGSERWAQVCQLITAADMFAANGPVGSTRNLYTDDDATEDAAAAETQAS